MHKTTKKITSRLLCTGATALLAAPFNPALAQTTGDNTEQSKKVLEEVTVTARKKVESLQDTPVVISALSSKTIEDFAIESMEDIADFTPGLLNAQRENQLGGVLALRGVGTSANSPILDQAVSLVVDDMQIGSLQIQRTAMLDMEAVQVYKGPQALFFGKNSPGGVLSIRSADPGEEFEGQIKTGYEFEADEWFVQGMVSSPFSETAAGRLVVRHSESDGYFKIDDNAVSANAGGQGPESEETFLRGTLLLDPTDDLSIRTKLTYANRESGAGFNIQRFDCPLGAPQSSLPFECEGNDTVQISDIPQAAIDVFAAAGLDAAPEGLQDTEQYLATVAADYDINDSLTLTSVTGYYENTFKSSYSTTFGLLSNFFVPALQLDFEQFTQEVRLSSSFDGDINFVGGVFYEQKTHDSISVAAADLGVLLQNPAFSGVWSEAGRTSYTQDTEAYSVFIDMTWDITDDLELSGGARYSYEEKDMNGIAGIDGKDSEDWDNISPQVTLSWRPNFEWMFYGSYREGFKSGGFDGSFKFEPTPPSSYEEEEVSGFEFGAKWTSPSNTLQVNTAVYRYEYTELQLSNFNAETLSAEIFNAGEAEIQGIEVDFVWATPVEGLQARGAIAYNDSELDNALSSCYGGQTIDLGCNLVFDPDDGVFTSQDISGNPLALAPEITANLALSYEYNFDNLVLGLSTDILYSDDYEPSYLFVPGTKQDSYTQLNAAIRLSSADNAWSATLIGRNLTDEYPAYSTAAVPLVAEGFGTGTDGSGGVLPMDAVGTFSPGRTISLEFEYNFK